MPFSDVKVYIPELVTKIEAKNAVFYIENIARNPAIIRQWSDADIALFMRDISTVVSAIAAVPEIRYSLDELSCNAESISREVRKLINNIS